MIGAQFLHQRQHRLQVVHASADSIAPASVMPWARRKPVTSRAIGRIDEAHAAAVEAGIPDHAQLFRQRPFLAVGPAPLHGPKRLIDQQFLRHVLSRFAREC